MYADLEAGGLARSTVRLLHTQLHRAMADAVRWDLLARNPADLVDPPKPARRVLTTWTAEQLRTFLAGVAEDRLAALYQLAAASGMRIGELVGLEWPDVHLDGGYLMVRRAKTATGRRRVELDPATIAVLRAHRRRQAAEQLGHASVRVTLDTYSHVTPGVQREAVTRVASRFLAPAVGSLLANEPASATGATEAGSDQQ